MKIGCFNFLPWLAVASVSLFAFVWPAPANPAGMTVQSGSASAAINGSTLTVTTSQNTFLNWQTFNIAAGETTIFNQPSASSVVVNNIHDANASQIYGSLQANGVVVLINASGFYFGPNSFVKTGGLVLSTANCLPPQNGGGGSWVFNGPPPLASIVNYGQIQVGNGSSAFLIANNVENHGTISAPGGSVGLASGQTVLLSDRPDGRGMSMQVTMPQGSVNNYGTIIADGGTIAMNARVVNQNGLLQANSVRDVNGTIELVASDQLDLGASSHIAARGDDSTAGSFGGTVTLQSGNDFNDDVGSRIDVGGGVQGGNGGSVEISAPNVLSLNSAIDARAQVGWTAGTLLLDPDYITLDTSGTGSASGTVSAGSSPGSTLDLNVDNAFANLAVSQIILQAVYDITFAGSTSWNLSQTIGANLGGVTSGQLTLQAGRNITFQDGSSLSDAHNWSVNLAAGYNFANNTVQPGIGNIFLNGGLGMTGGGSIQMASGGISLMAGQDITAGSGYVITTGGGSIYAHALNGNIDTGSDAQGYHFVNSAGSLSAAYNFQNGLGGISTEAGGDVSLIAGGNVTSVLPGKGVYYYDGNQVAPDNGNDYLTAGSGAYGSQPGNVTVVAGGNVTGNYLVANGTGNIFAGVEMDANGNPVTDSSGNYVLGTTGSAGTDLSYHGLALNLIHGGWNVAAAQNIFLQEVRNPNGVFNGSGSFSHYFNYAPNAYVNLSAGNLVQLGASVALPRLSGGNNNVPIIYPSILNVTAGSGGVILGAPGSSTSLTLFPSAQGSLTIDTTGSLVSDLNSISGAPQLFNLVVSDSSSHQYTSSTSFGINDHAASPVHLNNPTPMELDIAGNMQLVNLVVPEAAQINVGGNMINCGFQGMNLSPAPGFQVQVQEADGSTRMVTVDPGVTSISVTGDIYDRSAFTDLTGVTPAEAANLFYLSESLSSSISAATLASSFFYNPATETLTYENINTATLQNVLNVLNNLPVQEYINGVPQYVNGDPADGVILAPNPVSVLGNPTTPGTVAYALLAQYNALGAIPKNANTFGYFIGGGGQFNVTARSIDLGTSAGIQSEGVSLYNIRGNYPLAGLFGTGGAFNHGADVNVTTTGSHSGGETANSDLIGDLDMYSSSIASMFGGNISINVGGDVNVGSSVFTVNSLNVRGIYTTSQGDLSIIAEGNIDCNGSRIVTYDGGNITVESLNGSVNAGSGASTPVQVTGFYENPVTHAVYTTSPQIPFSGIVALTFPARDASYPAPPSTLGNILVEAPNGDINANAAGILQIALNGLNYPDAVTTVLAGYELRDSSGNALAAGSPLASMPTVQGSLMTAAPTDPAQTVVVGNEHIQVSSAVWAELISLLGLTPGSGQDIKIDVSSGQTDLITALQGNNTDFANFNYLTLHSTGHDINANGSGVIASNAKLEASGNINGLIFARDNLDINAQNNVNVTALAIGNANVSGQQVIGTITGVGGVSVSGDSISASLISANVSGATSGQSGLGQGTAANATAAAASSSGANQTVASTDQGNNDDQKKKKEVALAQKVSRVTVVLPANGASPGPARKQTSSQKQTATQPL
ncbi:MAG TPA: filamentous hemagglutinin N-terminal domain-containing protein [Verrucomicrobiae bacterium]|nr:filamentous hemagglutinin N-terminal domain-containing protein [Verrucomicrobiae bacterium]